MFQLQVEHLNTFAPVDLEIPSASGYLGTQMFPVHTRFQGCMILALKSTGSRA